VATNAAAYKSPTSGLAGTTKRQRMRIVHSQLDVEFATFRSHLEDIANHTMPRRPLFLISDNNRGEKKNQKIIDSTATFAARTLSAGMMGGVTSPARPWFRVSTPDPRVAELPHVKEWLHQLTSDMRAIFLRSNLYNMLPILYTDLALFGTAAMLIEEDAEDVIRCTVFPIGSYRISCDAKGRVTTFIREFRMTVRQLVEKFAERDRAGNISWANFSPTVKEAWEKGSYEQWIEVVHFIGPNEQWNPYKATSKHKRFASCYYEKGYGGPSDTQDNGVYLRESGYDYFPVLVPRWGRNAEDAWGTQCPGMDALGDIKQLQKGERDIAHAIEKLLKPPMVGSTSLREQEHSTLPGGMTYTDERDGQKGFRAAFQIDPRIQEMENKQEQVRQRILRAFFADLFLMLHYSDRRQITAREIDERAEEKLIALGPVLEQLNQDLLDPLIEITFGLMMRQRRVYRPPAELSGANLKVEYISMMAQAQKMIGVGGLERFTRFVGELSKVVPSILQKVDWDEAADEHGESMGVSPRVLRSDELVAQIREAESRATAQMAQAEQAKNLAGATKSLSEARMDTDSVLRAMARGISGGGALDVAAMQGAVQ
jgi:hypothetical protein